MVLAPDRLADVNGMEIVEAEIESVRQLLGFEGKLDAKAESRNVVNQTRVHALILNHDLCGMVRPGTLYSSVFHLTIRSLGRSFQSQFPDTRPILQVTTRLPVEAGVVGQGSRASLAIRYLAHGF